MALDLWWIISWWAGQVLLHDSTLYPWHFQLSVSQTCSLTSIVAAVHCKSQDFSDISDFGDLLQHLAVCSWDEWMATAWVCWRFCWMSSTWRLYSDLLRAQILSILLGNKFECPIFFSLPESTVHFLLHFPTSLKSFLWYCHNLC